MCQREGTSVLKPLEGQKRIQDSMQLGVAACIWPLVTYVMLGFELYPRVLVPLLGVGSSLVLALAIYYKRSRVAAGLLLGWLTVETCALFVARSRVGFIIGVVCVVAAISGLRGTMAYNRSNRPEST